MFQVMKSSSQCEPEAQFITVFFFWLLGLCDVKESIYEGLTNQKSVLKGEELKQNLSDRE